MTATVDCHEIRDDNSKKLDVLFYQWRLTIEKEIDSGGIGWAR
jgi:hypothetical protein